MAEDFWTKFNLQLLILFILLFILFTYSFYPEALCDRNLKYGYIP
jgi:hypothetical protein